jgi:hypothetical protein
MHKQTFVKTDFCQNRLLSKQTVKTDFCQNRLLSKQTFVTSFFRNVLMLFALFNLTSFEAVSQQYFNFPHYDPNPPNYVNTDWIPSGLTPTTSPKFAHSFTCKLRVAKNPDIIWEPCGGISISQDANPQDQLSGFYLQDFTYRAVARTFFNDIAYIPKDALWRLYQRITSGTLATYINSLTQPKQDSIYAFIFSPPLSDTLPPRPREYENVRPGLLVVAGQYTTAPNISCGGENPVRTNAAIYVVDAGSLQPLRMFKFFQCLDTIKTSNFTAIRYLDIVDRFVAVGSCDDFNNNTDILSFNGDLLYLLWENLPGTDAMTHKYDIKDPYVDDTTTRLSCNDIATGVDLRYFKTVNSNGEFNGYSTNAGAIMVSAYLTNSIGQEKSVLLRLNHDGSPVPGPCKVKLGSSNNRAHAVSFLTDDVGIWEYDPAELGVTGYLRVNQVDNIYIAKFDQIISTYGDKRYPINNTITENPGFSIVSTGDGYAVTGRYKQLNSIRGHLSYLRVDNNLNSIEHTIFPSRVSDSSYGQRMRFDNGSGLILGGSRTLDTVFSNCWCNGATSCKCPQSWINCPEEWRAYTKNPLTVTRTNSNPTTCHPSINTQSIPCGTNNFCWEPMTVCKLAALKPKYDVCQSPLPNGKVVKLYDLKGTNCAENYCGQQ